MAQNCSSERRNQTHQRCSRSGKAILHRGMVHGMGDNITPTSDYVHTTVHVFQVGPILVFYSVRMGDIELLWLKFCRNL